MPDNKEKKETARDNKGVRKQTYKRFEKGKDYQPIEPGQTAALAEIFRRGVFGETVTEQGEKIRNKGGQPKKYESIESFQDVIDEYLDYIEGKAAEGVALIPDIEGFCSFAGICRDSLNDWERSRPGEYSDMIKRLKNCIAAWKKQLALSGKIPPIVFATDFNNNHGYIQQQHIDIQANRPLEQLPDRETVIKLVQKQEKEEEKAAADLENLLK